MKFYLTTPIYYVTAAPHIGHAYTTVAADCLARFHRMAGRDVFFLTGTDEHGQKIEDAAKQRSVGAREIADEMSAAYRAAWERLDISHDRFIRTTEEAHEALVRDVFAALAAKGDIYAGEYRGLYCVHCESYVTPGDDPGVAKCPDCGRPVSEIAEKSYFFRLSKYAERLKRHIGENPDFVKPDFRKAEVLNFIDRGLTDVSITRQNCPWGIESPTPERFSIYVWFDALVNYLTGAGYRAGDGRFEALWPPDVQLMAKDIIRFHHILWPAVLMALDLSLPKTVFAHGFWIMGRDKMSKSKGNVVSPDEIVPEYGVSALRFFLMREVPFGLDGEYSAEGFRKRYNSDLANDYGNLVNRTLNLVEKKCGGAVPDAALEDGLARLADEVFAQYAAAMERIAPSEAIDAVWRLVTHLNKRLDEKAPWRLEGAAAGEVLYQVLEGIRRAALFLAPVMPDTTPKIHAMLGLPPGSADRFERRNERLAPGLRTGERTILFPRRT